MYRKKRFNTFKYGIFAVIIALVTVLSICCVTPLVFADSTENTGYSNVLDDLQQDETFDISKYSENIEDNSLQVIQIAESTDNELLIYVYQPSGQTKDLRASSINISIEESSLDFINYKLIFLNSNGVFFKYKVDNFTVLTTNLRYYEISSIFRIFDSNIDEPASSGVINEIVYPVELAYTFIGNDNNLTITCNSINTIKVTDKYVGFIRYQGVENWVQKSCDRHFIAFSTDKPIDRLIEADIYYQVQSLERNFLANYDDFDTTKPFSEKFGTIEDKYSHLSINDNNVEVSVGSSGLIGFDRYFTYSWQGIQTVEDFIDSVNVDNMFSMGLFDVNVSTRMTSEGLEDLKTADWVLSFDATDFIRKVHATGGGGNFYSTIVSNVSVMRLMFEYDGDIYNLGVIDNKQSNDGEPDNDTTTTVTIPDWLETLIKALIGIVVGVLLVVIMVVLFPYIINFLVRLTKLLLKLFKYIFIGIWYVIKYLALGVWYLVASPYYIFKWIQNK